MKLDTPELDKMHDTRERLRTQEIGDFLEWLNHVGIVLARRHEHQEECDSKNSWVHACGYEGDDPLELVVERREDLLARYAGVDLKGVEKEKRALFEEARRHRNRDEGR